MIYILNRTYLEPKAKRNLILLLSDHLKKTLESDMQFDPRGGNRPRTPFMSAVIADYRGELENMFHKFCEQHAAENFLDSAETFAMLNTTELLVLLGDGYNPKDFDFDEDKVTFLLFYF